ncbi:MAG TPA: hypothetical protein VGM90_29835 [Kofleriaceae bacterium]|jgi:hypothetical protein
MRFAGLLLVVVTSGCSVTPGTLDIPNANPQVFEDTVYPVLLADCAFNACHGNRDRFFSVFGPGRERLDPNTAEYDPVTPYELAHSYTRAESMLYDEEGPGFSLFVRKPIPLALGGAGHKGDDLYGGTVYSSIDDPHYLALYRWATGGAQ